MPRPRSSAYRNWPTGLYPNPVDGKVYYRWLDPRTKKMVPLGSDFATAREAATQKNAELAVAPVQRLLNRMEKRAVAKSFGDACDAWLLHLKARERGRGTDVRSLSDKTISDYEGYVRRFKEHFGADEMIGGIALEQIASYLEKYGDKARARNMARGILIQVWTYARAQGWVAENVPDQTLKVDHAVISHRLTIDQFNAVIEAAEKDEEDAWFAPAARFALYCDQRRGDVSNIPASAWNPRTGTLVFTQEKTRHKVTVKAGPMLTAAIADCFKVSKRADGIIRKPDRQEFVSPDMLTKTFARVRDELIRKKHKAWRQYKPAKAGVRIDDGRPPWREIRSLGAVLMKVAGKDNAALAGHASEAMEALYQKGHVREFEAESL